ncbi:unnamed protein product, partial [Polarella glacialis]
MELPRVQGLYLHAEDLAPAWDPNWTQGVANLPQARAASPPSLLNTSYVNSTNANLNSPRKLNASHVSSHSRTYYSSITKTGRPAANNKRRSATSTQPSHIPGGAATAGGRVQIWAHHRLIARILASFPRSVAHEVARVSDDLRDQYADERAERQAALAEGAGEGRLAAREEALKVLRECELYIPSEAEAVIRQRVNKLSEHPLHVYGVFFHTVLYPITIFLAILAYIRIACTHSLWGGENSGKSLMGYSMGAYMFECVLRVLTSLSVLLAALPVSVCLVIAFVPIDISLLLLRPLLPGRVRRTLNSWPYPTSLAFWVAGLCGYWPAVLAHRFLGSAPTGEGVLLGFGSRQAFHPPLAFRAAVVCDPHFMAEPYLRAPALKGVPEDVALSYSDVGAAMPLAV